MVYSYVYERVNETQRFMVAMLMNKYLMITMQQATFACKNVLEKNKIILAGIGGSAANAQHFAGEFFSRFTIDCPGLGLLL